MRHHGTTTIATLALILTLVYTVSATDLRFDPSRGLVEVSVLIDGRATGTFGIDTGADRLYVDRDFAEDNSLSLKSGPPERRIMGVHGTSDAKRLDIRSLRIGDETLYNLRATAVDIGALASDEDIAHPDGLIGYQVLRQFYVTVDFPNRLMQLRTGEPADIVAVRKNFVPFEQQRHMIIVNVRFDDEYEVPMVLDYCAAQTSISPGLAKKLGLEADEGDRVTVDKIQLGDKVASSNVPCVVDDLERLNQAVRGASFEGLLGGTFLHGFKITVDYAREKIYLHPR